MNTAALTIYVLSLIAPGHPDTLAGAYRDKIACDDRCCI